MDKKQNTCCFFGHREVTHNIRPKLIEIIEKLIVDEGVTDFYVGHQGQFDSMVYSVLKELKAKFPHIRYTVVLAYMPDEHIRVTLFFFALICLFMVFLFIFLVIIPYNYLVIIHLKIQNLSDKVSRFVGEVFIYYFIFISCKSFNAASRCSGDRADQQSISG